VGGITKNEKGRHWGSFIFFIKINKKIKV